jgi:hypothetical protein
MILSRFVSLCTGLLLVWSITASIVKVQNNSKKNLASHDVQAELVSIAESALRAEYDEQKLVCYYIITE